MIALIIEGAFHGFRSLLGYADILNYATNTMTFAADIQNQSWNKAYTSTTFDKYKTTRRGTDNKLMKSLANKKDLRDIAKVEQTEIEQADA